MRNFDYVEHRPLTFDLESYVDVVKNWVKETHEINQVPIEILTAVEELEYAAQNMIDADKALRVLMKV